MTEASLPPPERPAADSRWQGIVDPSAARTRRWRTGLWIACLLAGLVYVGNAWSPSSYALALRYFGVTDSGLVAGTPRAIRADEWAVHTPQLQAALRVDGQRINTTSFYREDLRHALTLPLADWAMAIKPLQWGYLVLPAPYAFALSWFLGMVLFLAGYARLFAMAGAPPLHGALLSATLFATLYVQSFWTILAGPLALFPWVVLAAGWRAPAAWVAPVYTWVAASWLLSMFYPPLFVILAAVAAAWLVAFRPEALRPRRAAMLVAATLAAAASVAFYLRDYLRANLNTFYPGQRRAEGGEVLGWDFLSQFFPSSFVGADFQPLLTDNICMEASAGCLFVALVLCGLNWRALAARVPDDAVVSGRRLLAPVALLLAIWLWMYLPLPGWVGVPLLWDRVPGERMEFAAGLLLLLLAYLAAQRAGFAWSVPRALLFTALALLALAAGKGLAALGRPGTIVPELAAVALAWALVAVWRVRPVFAARHGLSVALAGGAVIGALAYGSFNPLQSAHAIFRYEATPVSRELDRVTAEAKARGEPLAVPGFFGAVLNGRGYPSVAHVLVSPQVERLTALFPQLDRGEAAWLFNRYAHVQVRHDIDRPLLQRPDSLAIPGDRWSAQVLFPRAVGAVSRDEDARAQASGRVERATLYRDGGRTVLRLEGWAAYPAWSAAQALHVAVEGGDPAARPVLRESAQRPDVAAFIGAADDRQGFTIDVPLAPGAPGAPRYCVLALDGDRAMRLSAQGDPARAEADCRALTAGR